MQRFQEQEGTRKIDEMLDALLELSNVLRCGLNKNEIEILLQLADKGGLNAEALASIVIGLREECLRVQAIESYEKKL